MLRILAFSDVRVQHVSHMEAIAARERPDLILYGGDDVGRFVAGPHSWAGVAQHARLGLAGVIGNDCHPADARAFDQPRCHDLHAAPLLLEDLAILGLRGAPSDDADGIGIVLYTRAEAEAQLAKQMSLVGDRNVLLVSHTPPRGVLDEAVRFGAAAIGSTVVRTFLERPETVGVVCGHAHMRGGQTARVKRAMVVNIASHDQPGAPLRYALLTWDGERLRATCAEERDNDPLADIIGVGPKRHEALRDAGFATWEDILAGDGRDVAAVLGAPLARGVRAQARALATERPVLLNPNSPFPSRPVVVDVETSHDHQDDPWLIGWKVWGSDAFDQQVELDARQHAAHLSAFATKATASPETQFVQWGSFDRSAIQKAHRRVGLPVPPWLEASRWFDAGAWVRRMVALPITSCGLKAVARHLGYDFAHPGVDGLTVGSWYARYRDDAEVFDVEKVLAYNADDVRSVEHVVQAVQALAKRGDLIIEQQVPAVRRAQPPPAAAPTLEEVQAFFAKQRAKEQRKAMTTAEAQPMTDLERFTAELDRAIAKGWISEKHRERKIARYRAIRGS